MRRDDQRGIGRGPARGPGGAGGARRGQPVQRRIAAQRGQDARARSAGGRKPARQHRAGEPALGHEERIDQRRGPHSPERPVERAGRRERRRLDPPPGQMRGDTRGEVAQRGIGRAGVGGLPVGHEDGAARPAHAAGALA